MAAAHCTVGITARFSCDTRRFFKSNQRKRCQPMSKSNRMYKKLFAPEWCSVPINYCRKSPIACRPILHWCAKIHPVWRQSLSLNKFQLSCTAKNTVAPIRPLNYGIWSHLSMPQTVKNWAAMHVWSRRSINYFCDLNYNLAAVSVINAKSRPL